MEMIHEMGTRSDVPKGAQEQSFAIEVSIKNPSKSRRLREKTRLLFKGAHFHSLLLSFLQFASVGVEYPLNFVSKLTILLCRPIGGLSVSHTYKEQGLYN